MWVFGLDSPRLHAEVRERLTWRSEPNTATLEFVAEPYDDPNALPDIQTFQSPRWRALLPFVMRQFPKDRGLNGLSLSDAVLLLERLTTDRPFSDSASREYWQVTHNRHTKEDLLAALKKQSDLTRWVALFWQQWRNWCLSPPSDRELWLVKEYEGVHGAITKKLAEDGGQSSFRKVLRRTYPLRGSLTLGSCEVPRDWDKHWPTPEAPHEWTVAFLAHKHETHTRDIKERLARARREAQIQPAWRAYGGWLRDHPEAIHEIERLLDVLIRPVGAPEAG